MRASRCCVYISQDVVLPSSSLVLACQGAAAELPLLAGRVQQDQNLWSCGGTGPLPALGRALSAADGITAG